MYLSCELARVCRCSLLLETSWAIVDVCNNAVSVNARIVRLGGSKHLIALRDICHAFVKPLWDLTHDLVVHV